MIENERFLNLETPERLYAISSGGLLGLATGLCFFSNAPSIVSTSILVEGTILGWRGVRKVITRDYEEFMENKGWKDVEK